MYRKSFRPISSLIRTLRLSKADVYGSQRRRRSKMDDMEYIENALNSLPQLCNEWRYITKLEYCSCSFKTLLFLCSWTKPGVYRVHFRSDNQKAFVLAFFKFFGVWYSRNDVYETKYAKDSLALFHCFNSFSRSDFLLFHVLLRSSLGTKSFLIIFWRISATGFNWFLRWDTGGGGGLPKLFCPLKETILKL